MNWNSGDQKLDEAESLLVQKSPTKYTTEKD